MRREFTIIIEQDELRERIKEAIQLYLEVDKKIAINESLSPIY